MTMSAWLPVRRVLTATGAGSGVAAAIGAAAIAASLGFTGVAFAADKATYSIWFKGLLCRKEAIHSRFSNSDETFVIVTAVGRNRRAVPLRIPEGQEAYYGDVDQNELRFANLKVWSGPAQNVELIAQVYDFDGHARKAFAVITGLVAELGLFLATKHLPPGTVPTGALGEYLAGQIVSKMRATDHDLLGSAHTTVWLAQVGTTADRALYFIRDNKGRKLTYDFKTVHKGGGAHYELFWEVRRTRPAPIRRNRPVVRRTRPAPIRRNRPVVRRTRPAPPAPTARTSPTVWLCNRSRTQAIDTAIAYWDPGVPRQKGWTSEGWWGVKRNQCVEIPVKTTGDVYVYAKAARTQWPGRDASFCINGRKAFKIQTANRTQCGRRPYRRVNMSKITIGRGRNTFNFE